ncbi:MAG: Gfo/Idh/MocA family oxidoreductase [Collinsella sp.]
MSLKVGIVGAAGYAGAELIRLVLGHPEFELVAITSNADAGQPLSAVYPSFTGVSDLVFTTHDAPELKNCDAVFLAVPHTAAMAQVPALLAAGVSCIDLSADYRLSDPATFEPGMPPSTRAPSCSRPAPSVCPSCSART